MFIIKWEKGIFKALGLHHDALACSTILILYIIGGLFVSIFALGAWTEYYFIKESRENGKDFEILDFIGVPIFGTLTIWGLNAWPY